MKIPPMNFYRKLRASMVLVIGLSMISVTNATEVSFQAFVRGHTNTEELEQAIKQHMQLSAVTVHDRLRDFMNELTALQTSDPTKATMILMPGVFANRMDEKYTITLYQMQGQKKSEPYLIVSTDKDFNIREEQNCRMAILDFIGNTREIRNFFEQYFGEEACAKGKITYRRVNKLDDLLLTLSMDLSDIVMVPQSQLDYLQSQTSQKFFVHAKSKEEVPLLVLITPKNTTSVNLSPYLSRFKKIKEISNDTWKSENEN
jgi:hypothetical protein